MDESNKTRVIFFDGVCGLCNGFVDFVMRIDKKKKFTFSPLQSDFAKRNLDPVDIDDLKSVVVKINGENFRKSEAVFKVLSELSGVWKLLSVLSLLPNSLLNFGYDFIARNRYKIFGKKESCRLPRADERERFIL